MNNKVTITQDDIARKLNVSKVTVSKALRGHPDISKETSEKIKKLAAEMGYTPNYMARNLSSNKSGAIGVVIPKIAHYFFSSVIEAIYNTAFYNNYEIILTVSQENSEREKKQIETLLSMRVDGIIVSISQETQDKTIFERVVKLGVPLVFMDRILDIEGTSKVTVDDTGGAFKAVELAIKNGYTKIAHIAGYKENYIGRKRYLGFEEAMIRYKLEINKDWVVNGGFGEEDGYKAFMKIYKTGKLPEFIFAVTYPVAIGIYAAVEEVGLKIIDDVDIICFGNSDVIRFIKPSLSCVNQPTENLGKTAVEMIINQVNHINNFEPRRIELPTDIILRETCSKRKNGIVH